MAGNISFLADKGKNKQVTLKTMCTYQMLLLLLAVLFYFLNFQASSSKLLTAAKLNFVQSISQTKFKQ